MKKLLKSVLAVLLAVLVIVPLAMPASAGPTMGMGGPEIEIPTMQQFAGVFIGGAVLTVAMFGLLRSDTLTGIPVLGFIISAVLWMLLAAGVVLAALGVLGFGALGMNQLLTRLRS